MVKGKSNKVRLGIEQLEGRDLASASVNLVGSVLTVQADDRGDTLVASQPQVGVIEIYQADTGQTWDFAQSQVTQLFFLGGRGGDSFYNNTSLASVQQANNDPGKVTSLFGGTTADTLLGGNGGDVYETLRASGSEIASSNPNAVSNLFALGGTHTLITGPGINRLYSIIGADNIQASAGSGYLLVSAKAKVTASPNYSIVTFFQPALAASASPVVLQPDANGNGILYLTDMTSASVRYTINQFGAGPNAVIVVNYQGQLGSGSYTFARSSVQWAAFFSTTGVSDIENNSTVNDVFYAKSGSTLIGGLGAVDVLKLHSGSGYLVSRAQFSDLFAGPAGPGGQVIEVGGGIRNVFRNDVSQLSTVDFNVHRIDTVIGVPAYINGDFSANRSKPAVNADFAELVQDLKRPLF